MAYSSTATTTYRDGTVDTAAANIDGQGRGTLTFVSHEGVSLSAKFTDVSVATGTLTGGGDGFPAAFTLDIPDRDRLTVRFRDGSKLEFKEGTSGVAPRAAGKAAVARHRARLRAFAAQSR